MLQLLFILSIFNKIFPIDAYYVPANGEDWTILKPEYNKLPGSFDTLPFTFGIVVNPYVINDEGDYEEPVVSKIERSITTSFVTSVVTAAPKPTKTKDIIVQIHDGQVQKVASGYDWKKEEGEKEKYKDWDDTDRQDYEWKDVDKSYDEYEKNQDEKLNFDDEVDKLYTGENVDYDKHRKSDVDDVILKSVARRRRKRSTKEIQETMEILPEFESDGQNVESLETIEEVYEDINKDPVYENDQGYNPDIDFGGVGDFDGIDHIHDKDHDHEKHHRNKGDHRNKHGHKDYNEEHKHHLKDNLKQDEPPSVDLGDDIQFVSPVYSVACYTNATLRMTLTDGILRDSDNRIGCIVSGHQFQFDGPTPQHGAVFAAGWSVTKEGQLALGDSTKFYQCASGNFYNLYDEPIAFQCHPVTLDVVELIEC